MAPAEEMQAAMVNRSIRTIKAELEFLTDASVITPQTLSDLLSRIPAQNALHAPISVGAVPTAAAQAGQLQPSPAAPTAALNNLNVNGRQNGDSEKSDSSYYQPPAQSQPPPPAYVPPPQANFPPLAQATALYAYSSGDVGDLVLQPNDHIKVTEYMNAEWWKGISTRTGEEGIFPRSYVKVIEEKAPGNNYGNEPLAGNGDGKAPSKVEEGGKKFGKKLGNAAIFGAGATIGSNIVNSIF
nr:hypothetical protein B0A51_10017 [Rachicladosporium sp. CCFEE 5018]